MSIIPRQMLCPQSKKSIKFPFSMTPTRIAVHNTANDASANNEISYMNSNNKQVSFHFAVDPNEVVQGLPLNVNGWHSGDGNGPGNRSSIGIEICYSLSGGQRFIDSEKLAAKFIAQLLNERGWGIDRVTKHQDYDGKYCPHRTLDMGWSRFINMIRKEMGASPDPIPNPKPTNIKRNDLVKIAAGATYYNGNSVPSWVQSQNWYVKEDPSGDRVVIDKNEKGTNSICSPISSKYLTVVKGSGGTNPSPALKSTDEIAAEVIAGKWGNGDERKQKLTNAGYDYSTIQAAVNAKLSGSSTPNKKSVDTIAREVIRGDWGNGAERKRRLTAAGYDYSAIQNRVNELL